MPLPPIISCFIKIQIGLTFLVPAYTGCAKKEDVKWVSVCPLQVRKWITHRRYQQLRPTQPPTPPASYPQGMINTWSRDSCNAV